MYIKSIILDGFKSYGRRTEIEGFDQEFNAITGLNGTGKSNILDSICFVLGITNLSQVRAQSLQDLVYKSGQAGVTKATVTINFDNTKKSQCPMGYENCREISIGRQIVVGGKTKYLINGKNAQQKQVQDLFCSVQLNINNPNFLIMQGQITKVLNMKPPEILSMIEEACGTSMYENKKEKSMSLIQKKDNRLDELKSLIADEIQPKLEKLRKDQQQYQEYQKVCRDIEYLTRIHISFKYLQCLKAVENSDDTIAKLQGEMTKNRETIEKNVNEVAEIEETIEKLQEKIDENAGGDLKGLEAQLEELNQKDAKLKAAANVAQEEILSNERELKTLQKNIKIDDNALNKKETQMNQAADVFTKLKNDQNEDKKAYEAAEKKYEAVNIGLALNDEGEATSLQDQLTTAKSKIAEAVSTTKQSEMELKYSQQTLTTKEKNLKTNDSSYLKDKEVITKTEKEVKNLEAQLSRINYQDGSIEELIARQEALIKETRPLRSEMSRMDKFEFHYDKPIPNWDSRRVKGVASTLFRIKDPKYSRALSSVLGGNWRNVITDNEETGKLLLTKGNLQSRTTIIPLTKMKQAPLDERKVKAAQNLVGKENVVPSLDLIEYDKDVEPAMRYLFGWTFICKDLETAKKVTYNPQINTVSYTLDGDSMNPDGSLSGGAVQQGLPILDEATKYVDLKRELAEKENEIEQIKRQIASLEQLAGQFRAIKDKKDNFEMQLRIAEERIQKTDFQQNQDEINELKAKVLKLQETIESCKTVKTQSEAKVKDLTSKINDSKGHRERELKEADDELKKTKLKFSKSQKNWDTRKQEYETLELEIEELKKTRADGEAQVQKFEEKIENLKKKVVDTNSSDDDLKQEIEELRARIKREKDAIAAQNKEIRSKNTRKEKCLKANNDLNLEIKKQEQEITKVKADNTEGYNNIKVLEERYPWIPEDKDHFGARNTRYDYTKEDPKQAGKKLHNMQENKEKLSRNINQEAMVLLEKEEEHYKKIMDRRTKIENDRKKIIDSIKNMDSKKVEDLKKAWDEVNSNFGSIFSTLLPGTQAKLVPPEGSTFLKGLEVKIGFNGIWKESLTELSGGQRSLVALSLILAMLKYKPAPLYILDEVDAALDLSHTQNIGGMLKAHFKNSQFVIVSLKDGMFNNANVLFRTKFVDGVSGIIRTVNRR